jgi:hypothetical protein
MSDQHSDPPQAAFVALSTAIVADVKRHVASLRESGVKFYGYAVLPPDYYTAFDPTTIAVAFNRESDIDTSNRDQPYYRYSVDEWQNYIHEGFDAVNRELKTLLSANRSSIDDTFVDAVYQAILDGMLALRSENIFDDVPYLVIWLSDSSDGILNRSARLLNSPNVYSEFRSEFGE